MRTVPFCTSGYRKGTFVRPRKSQCGVALAMSLIFLLILTLFAVVSMNTGVLQEKMAGNMRDVDVSLQSAESAQIPARAALAALAAAAGLPPCQGNANGIWCVSTVDWRTPSWWVSNGIEYGGGGKQISEAYEDPYFATEELALPTSMSSAYYLNQGQGGIPVARYYRVHSRGTGTTSVSESIVNTALQTTSTN
jgi:type IV pilus assembly protein PilX